MISTSRIQSVLSPIIAVNGLFYILLGITALLIGLGCKLLGLSNADPFILSGLILNAIGGLACYLRADGLHQEMSMRQVLACMISFWVSSGLAATLPFIIGTPNLSFRFAFFESVSALTTTGATVMVGLDDMPESILLWRSILHWYGGMGIIIGAMVAFPAMRLGGMQFFVRKGSESEDKLLPSAKALGIAVLTAYTALTALCAIAYMLSGISPFDAINLAMSTMATGGLAVSDSSFMNYSDTAKLVASFFMILAGVPLVMHIRFMNGDFSSYWRDSQVRTYLIIIISFSILMTLYHIFHDRPQPFDALADAFFNSTSILTGTGFGDGDFQLWGSFPTALLFVAMFIGGCTGSTSGAIKIFRFQVLFEIIRSKIKSIIYPNAIAPPKYDGETIPTSITESVAAFLMIYIATFAIIAGAFSATGLTFIEAISASASAIGNVGPALGDRIGPVGSYAGFDVPQIYLYILGMILGRMEFVLFMVLFLPRFWRH